jgi:hypothetical protein
MTDNSFAARRGEHGQQTAAKEEAMMQKMANQSRNDGVTGKGFGEFRAPSLPPAGRFRKGSRSRSGSGVARASVFSRASFNGGSVIGGFRSNREWGKGEEIAEKVGVNYGTVTRPTASPGASRCWKFSRRQKRNCQVSSLASPTSHSVASTRFAHGRWSRTTSSK